MTNQSRSQIYIKLLGYMPLILSSSNKPTYNKKAKEKTHHIIKIAILSSLVVLK